MDSLSWFEEVFFYRLIVNADDFGCFDARPAMLKARLFPLKTVSDKQINDALLTLEKLNVIMLYTHDGRRFLYFKNWDRHQQQRTKKRKYPEPDIRCNQMISDDIRSSSSDSKWCDESESESESEIESESEYSSEVKDTSEPEEPPVIEFPLVDKTWFPIYQTQLIRWTDAYPAVDVMLETKRMVAWLEANPKNKKTRAGIMKFANSWLSRAQDDARATNTRGRYDSRPLSERIMEM